MWKLAGRQSTADVSTVVRPTLPNLLEHVDRLRPLVQGGRLGLMLDFDGTLAEIAPTPDEAVISGRARESVRRLVQRLDLVCVMSGRTASDLRDKVGIDGVTYVGNHGVEYLEDERLWVAPRAAEYRDRTRSVFDHIKANVTASGLVWDDKYYSASVHYRLAENPALAEHALAAALNSAPGADELDVFWGKMVMEIRAPAGLHKGYAVRRLVRERRLRSAVVIGDDTTDVDALVALKELRDGGRIDGVGVAVLQEDSPGELLAAADYGLDGVSQVEVFLEWMDGASG